MSIVPKFCPPNSPVLVIVGLGQSESGEQGGNGAIMLVKIAHLMHKLGTVPQSRPYTSPEEGIID